MEPRTAAGNAKDHLNNKFLALVSHDFFDYTCVTFHLSFTNEKKRSRKCLHISKCSYRIMCVTATKKPLKNVTSLKMEQFMHVHDI